MPCTFRTADTRCVPTPTAMLLPTHNLAHSEPPRISLRGSAVRVCLSVWLENDAKRGIRKENCEGEGTSAVGVHSILIKMQPAC